MLASVEGDFYKRLDPLPDGRFKFGYTTSATACSSNTVTLAVPSASVGDCVYVGTVRLITGGLDEIKGMFRFRGLSPRMTSSPSTTSIQPPADGVSTTSASGSGSAPTTAASTTTASPASTSRATAEPTGVCRRSQGCSCDLGGCLECTTPDAVACTVCDPTRFLVNGKYRKELTCIGKRVSTVYLECCRHDNTC